MLQLGCLRRLSGLQRGDADLRSTLFAAATAAIGSVLDEFPADDLTNGVTLTLLGLAALFLGSDRQPT